MVLAFHAGPRFAPGGFIGVDIFFVISGYLIAGIIYSGLNANQFSFAEFYYRRFVRLLPAMVTVLASTWLLGWFILLPADFSKLIDHIIGALLFLSNMQMYSESGYFNSLGEFKILLHFWSLGIEEQFYLIFPLFIVFIWKLKYRFQLIVLLFASSLATNIAMTNEDSQASFFLLHTRMWELSSGAMLAYLQRYRPSIWSKVFSKMESSNFQKFPISKILRNVISFVGVILIVLSLVLFSGADPYPGWRALLPVVGTVLLISAGPGAVVNSRILANPILVFIGLISYPLYLWHWPLLSFAQALEVDHASKGLKILVLVVSAILAWATYRFIEKPIRGSLTAVNIRWRPRVGFIVIVTLIGSAGLLSTLNRDGFPDRFPKIIADLSNFKYDDDKEYRFGECFLDSSKHKPIFPPSCYPNNTTQPVVAILGDSMAAHLYPGLMRLQDQHNFQIVQFTAGSCVPLFSVSQISETRKSWNQANFCDKLRVGIYDAVSKIKPDYILLAARWQPYIYKNIEDTIAAFSDMRSTKTVIIGPAPEWLESLQRVLIAQLLRNNTSTLPNFMSFKLDTTIAGLDAELGKISASMGIPYVSAYKSICTDKGCRVSFNGDPKQLTSWDYGHLTTAGSNLVAQAIINKLGL